MFIELHILQNFAPSNLNRDDTGAPKDCEFGGFRRARISSQCLKRAMRTYVRDHELLPAEQLGQRSRQFTGKLAERLVEKGRVPEQARAVVEAALGSLKLQAKDGVSQYLLFFGNQELDAIAAACQKNWDALVAVAMPAEQAGGRRDVKKAAQAAVPAEVKQALEAALQGTKAADVSMFGRMLADLPEHNVDAASQVAHAISTHRVTVDFDYYTAVDDLNPDSDTGAGMIGTVEFNSACYYRYLNVDTAQLLKNMGRDRDLAAHSLSAFLRAAVLALPGGKQNSTAAQSRPGLVLAVARPDAPVSLVNAFERPVRTGQREIPSGSNGAQPDEDSVTEISITRLAHHFRDLNDTYGDQPAGIALVTLHPDALDDGLRPARVSGLDTLLERTVATAFSAAVSA